MGALAFYNCNQLAGGIFEVADVSPESRLQSIVDRLMTGSCVVHFLTSNLLDQITR